MHRIFASLGQQIFKKQSRHVRMFARACILGKLLGPLGKRRPVLYGIGFWQVISRKKTRFAACFDT